MKIGVLGTGMVSEMYLPLWLNLYGQLQTGEFNIGVIRAKSERG